MPDNDDGGEIYILICGVIMIAFFNIFPCCRESYSDTDADSDAADGLHCQPEQVATHRPHRQHRHVQLALQTSHRQHRHVQLALQTPHRQHRHVQLALQTPHRRVQLGPQPPRNAPVAPQEPPDRRLDPGVLASLPIVVFQANAFEEEIVCTVCLSEIEDGERARILPTCSHGFHLGCIDMWLQSHSTCPVCRRVIGLVRSDPPTSSRLQLPTNVLFWGGRGRGAPIHASSTSFPPPPPPTPPATNDGMVVIDVGRYVIHETHTSSTPSPPPPRPIPTTNGMVMNTDLSPSSSRSSGSSPLPSINSKSTSPTSATPYSTPLRDEVAIDVEQGIPEIPSER